MALIDCPECGAEISSSAQACPSCAFPISRRRGQHTGQPERTAQRTWELGKQILARVVLGGVLFASGAAWEAPPVIISALVVFGSTVPLWLKARKAALMGGSGDGSQLEARMRQYVAEAEERQMRLADLEEENSRRVVELEERVDFAERLLARQGDSSGNREPAVQQLPPSRM